MLPSATYRTVHPTFFTNNSFSPNDTKFVSAGDDNLIKIWDFNEAIEQRTLTGHGWEVRSVDWHPTKGLIASGSKDNLLKLWDPRTSRTLSTLHFHKNTVGMVRFQPHTGNLLASASRDGTCRILDLRTMKDFRILRGHEKDVSSVAWHPIHTSLVVTGGADGAIHHYLLDDVSSQHGQAQGSESSAITMQPTASVQYAHELAIWSLDWHPQGHILCSGSNDRATRFWARTRPGDPMFMKDRYHLGQEQADALGYTRRSAMKREEEEEQEDESNALVDQQMPLADQVTTRFPDVHGMNVPGLSVPGLNFGTTSNGVGSSLPAGLDLNSLPGLLQSFGGAGLLPGLGMNVPGVSRGAPLPMQNEAFHSERHRNTRVRSRSRDSRDRSPPRWDRDRDWDKRGRRDRDRDGYGRR
jgi:polyadenylation factor subunit 2